MKTILLRTLVIGATYFVFSGPAAHAVAVSPIAPGDIIFTEFFNGWHKLDPVTGQVTPLPWPKSSNFTKTLTFDIGGAILYDDFNGEVKRLNPLTGAVRSLNVPGVSLTDGFVVESNGDLLIANSGAISRYSRASQQTTTVTSGTFFAPNGIASGAHGRVFITEFFNDLWEIDPVSSARSWVTSADLSIPSLIEVRSDGDLIVKNFSPSQLNVIDPDTGSVALFSSDLPTFVRDIVLDANDALWLTSTDGIFRYDSSGGNRTLIASGTFFSPRAIAIVPQNWKAHAIPEPTAYALSLIAITLIGLNKVRPRPAH